ncbi:MAG: PepSY-associated TM helix domain-containing protein, partial [Paracoccaceae bacterium]
PKAAGRLVAPPRSVPRVWVWAAGIVLVVGVAFPVGGAVLLGVIVLDQTVLRLVPGVRRALS